MSDSSKRANVELDSEAENKSIEGVTNDSLGTVDIADSTGLDTDLLKGPAGKEQLVPADHGKEKR